MNGIHGWSDADTALLNEVYIMQCKSRMSAIYYEKRLDSLQKLSFLMEITIAVTASGSGVAALASAGSYGQEIWKILSLIAAIVAVIRPIYAPGKKIEEFVKQQQGYHSIYFSSVRLAHVIRQMGFITDDTRKRYDTIFDRFVQLSTEDEASPKSHVIKMSRIRVEQEMPSSSFWWPDKREGIAENH